jgi:adenylylsulfate kinase-like enzyme
MKYQYPLSDEVINQFLNEPVHHGTFNKAHKHIRRSYKSFGRRPISCYVTGHSGVGKTTLAKAAERKILKSTSSCQDAEILPVLRVTLRDGALPDNVRKDLLKELGVDFSGYAGRNLKELLDKQLKVCGVRLVIFDEFQHLLRKYDKEVNKKACEFIKTFIDETQIPVVLLGNPKGKKLFELYDELRTRFIEAGELLLMSCKEKDSFEYFRFFINKLMERFPLKTIDLSTDENIQRLMLATGGNLRTLEYILSDVLSTNRDGSKALELDDYQEAYEFTRKQDLRRKKGKGTRIVKPFEDEPHVIKSDLIHFQKRGFKNESFSG